MYMKLLLIAGLVASVGCQKSAHRDARRVSVLAEADHAKPDGTPWDNGGGDVIPVWGPFMLPSVFSTSPFPDLIATIVTADGDVSEYSSGTNKYGLIDSTCENRISCRWEIDVPGEAYALIITDADPSINPNMTWDGVKELIQVALSSTGTSFNRSDAPLTTSRQFVAGALFPAARGSSEEELGRLELAVRNWMDSAGTTLVPSISLPRQERTGCREHKCLSDADGINGSLAITAIDVPAPAEQKRGFGGLLSALKPRRNSK